MNGITQDSGDYAVVSSLVHHVMSTKA